MQVMAFIIALCAVSVYASAAAAAAPLLP